jgi:uncharacterized protein (DUF3084 family)
LLRLEQVWVRPLLVRREREEVRREREKVRQERLLVQQERLREPRERLPLEQPVG